MKFRLFEFVRNESHHKNGERVRVKITSQSKTLDGQDFSNLSKALCNIHLDVDVLVDNSDGTYELCIPTHQDWMKVISSRVQSILDGRASIEII